MPSIIEDTRQQAGKHDRKHDDFERMGVQLVRSKLPYGDYAAVPRLSVDTKKDLYELAGNVTQQHARFKAECESARDAGCKLVVLVENVFGITSLQDLATWSEPDRHMQMRIRKSGNRYARRIEGGRIAKACATMECRYGVRFEFCAPEESAERIVQILRGGEEK